MKLKFNGECPCGKYEMKLTIEVDEEEELFCPICTVSLEEEEKAVEVEDDD